MKNTTLALMTAFLTLSFVPINTKAASEPISVSTSDSKSVEAAKVDVLLARLAEIKSMDKSKMNSIEKKQLRKEVKSIKTQVKEITGGVYLSAGAVILIALLLILLL